MWIARADWFLMAVASLVAIRVSRHRARTHHVTMVQEDP